VIVACGPPPAPASGAASAVSNGSAASPGPVAPPGPSAQTPAPPPPARAAYDKPPQNILDILHAPSPPSVSLSPARDTLLLVTWVEYPPIERVAEPFVRLAGVRIEPRNHGRHDANSGYDIQPCATDFVLVRVQDGAETRVHLSPGGCFGDPWWSADGKLFAFRNQAEGAVEVWVGDATTGEARAIPGVRLNPMLGSTFAWMADQKTLLVKLVPDGLGPPPPAPVVPDRPRIQETHGEKGQSSTYEARDTLRSKHDEDLFDYYAASQLALVDAKTGAITKVGVVGPIADVDPAPGGDRILVETIEKPYSYVTAHGRFPRDVAIWDRSGQVVHRVAKIPAADRVPVHGVRTGPRDFAWRATEPATLVWAEALDGGDWNAKVRARDKVMMQKAPFTAPPVEVVRTEMRYEGIEWGARPDLALLREYDSNRQWRRVHRIDVDDPAKKPELLWDLSTNEHYKDPGARAFRALPNGARVLEGSGDELYLIGRGSSPDGDRPFLDRFDLATRKATRLFRSEKTAFEAPIALLEPKARMFLTWHQSPADPPNAFVRTLEAARGDVAPGEAVQPSAAGAVTHIPDPTPQVRAIKKRLVKYKRKDGLDLKFTLLLPPNYQEGTRLPTILNAYPLDYADPAKAGQVTGSEQLFTRLKGYRLLLLAGYAVVEDASFPIVGDPKKAYDTYLEQLVLDAQAAVDKAVAIGVADPDRIGVTGHSHGALMTVNLLAHSDLFRAGVATSGSYNKTLTPFGFQSERRSVWEAPEVYRKVSPFFVADKIKTPLLIVHGDDDANPGTTPIQAEKLFDAIRGNGGTARLVMLPHEPHHYTAMESEEQLAFEMLHWFDAHVKNADVRARGEKHAAP
jgi:dipeptidyl aminopeptidase/acylaminoacyl peptidase